MWLPGVALAAGPRTPPSTPAPSASEVPPDTSARLAAARALAARAGVSNPKLAPDAERLASIEEALGDWPKVVAALEVAARGYEASGDRAAELRVRLRLGQALVDHSLTPDRAREAYLRAARLADDAGDPAARALVDAGLSGWAARSAEAADLLATWRSGVDAFPFREDLVDDGGGLFPGPDGLLWVRRQSLARYDGTFLERVAVPDDAFVRNAFVDTTSGGETSAGDRLVLGTKTGILVRGPGDADWTRLPIARTNGVVASDGRGGLYVGQDDGVAHWSGGAIVETWPLPPSPGGPNEVLAITARGDRVYVVSRAGVEIRDGVGDVAGRPGARPRVRLWKNADLAPDDTRDVVTDRDGDWLLSTAGAWRVAGDRVVERFSAESLTHVPSVRSLLRTADDVVWMGLGRGVLRRDATSTGVFRERSDRFEQVFGLASHEGATWTLDQQGEINRIATPRVTVYDRRVLPSGWIYDVLPQQDGSLVVATGSGLARFDPSTLDAVVYGDDQHCFGIVVDAQVSGGADGDASKTTTAWVSDELKCAATVEGDLLDPGTSRRWVAGDGLPDGTPSGLADVGGRLCVRGDGGVACLGDDGAFVVPPDLAFTAGKPVTGLVALEDGGALVAIDHDGVYRTSPQGAPVRVDTTGLTTPILLLEAGQEILVAGTNDVRRWDGRGLVAVPGLPAGVQATRALRTRDGRLLVGARGVGLLVSDGSDWSIVGTQEGLPSQEIYALAESADGAIWVGTGGSGLARLDPARDPAPETIVATHGRAFLADDRGEHALGVVSLRDGHDAPKDPGRPPDGATWLQSTAGVFSMPADVATAPLAAGPLTSRLPVETSVDPGTFATSTATFDLAAVTPDRAYARERHLYRWRVDGGAWTSIRGQGRLSIPDLADGQHVLEVVAVGPDLVADATPAVVRFQVDVPWPLWTWPAGLAAVGLVGTTQRRRLHGLWLRASTLRYRAIPEDLFAPRGPVSGDDLVGRGDVLADLRRRAVAARQQGASVLLWAEPGAGLTSVLSSLTLSSPDVAVRVDLAAAQTSAESVCLLLRDAVSRATGHPSGPADEPTVPGRGRDSLDTSRPSPYRALERLIATTRQQMGAGTLAIVIDSGERLLQVAEEDEAHGPYLLAFLKHLVSATPGLLLVVGWTGDRGELLRRGEELASISTLLPLPALSAADVQSLVTRRGRGLVVLGREPAERIRAWTGGQPALVEAFGRALAARLRDARRNLVSDDDVEASAVSLADGALGPADAVWAQLPVKSRLVVAMLASLPSGADVEAVVALAREKQAPILDEEVRRAVADLVRDGRLVDKDGRLAFAVGLLRERVARAHPLAEVLERSKDVVGTWQILDVLGEGGMGVVYRARDLLSGQVCALKVMARHLASSPDARRRFLREANVLVRLRHPNVVRILARGEHDGTAYMALELLEGETIKAALRREGAFPWRDAVAIARDLASALEEIHRAGIVHRDIKSENVILTGPARVPKLMDFGIAHGAEMTSLTQTGHLIGTYSYMAPEQVAGGAAEASWDLYALGALLYEMLTGTVPFTASTTAGLLRAILFEAVEAPSAKRPIVPETVDEVAVRMLAKQVGERYADAGTVRRALEDLLA